MEAPKPIAGNNMARIVRVGIGISFLSVLATVAALKASAQPAGSFGGVPGIGGTSDDQSPVIASATAMIDPAAGTGTLQVTATIKKGWHIYSVTQQSGGPLKTKIKLDPKSDAELDGAPKAADQPDSHPEPLFNNLTVETHHEQVRWEIPIKLKPGIDPQSAKIFGTVNAQACEGTRRCLPPENYAFIAKTTLESAAAPAPGTNDPATPQLNASGEYRPANLHATLRGWIEPGELVPGSFAQLVIEASPDPDWHIYARADKPTSSVGARPTLIVFTDTSGLRYLHPVADKTPISQPSEGVDVAPGIHDSPVRWTVQFEVPAEAKSGALSIAGMLGIQTCKLKLSCDVPTGVHFRGSLRVGDLLSDQPAPLQFSPGKYAEAEQIAELRLGSTDADSGTAVAAAPSYQVIRLNDVSKNASLPLMILFGVLGGLILNLMPCALPVIGLKILGFAQQAGHDRRKILSLNLWYAAGMLAVFWVLAALSMGAQLGIAERDLDWGDQFRSTTFNIVMASVVFVMALSFLGVWEIPIPGFIGSGTSQKLASHEGASGAFAKGVMTTILATPCSGPFLGPVFALTLAQPPSVTYVIFTAIGVGMALPYLVIGAFPSLIAWLPKPGAWMETFKQSMGFVMLATLTYIFTFLSKDFFVPTFALLIGLGAACWWIGRTPAYEPLNKRLVAWAQGSVFALLVGWFAFSRLGPAPPGQNELAWRPFSMSQLQNLSRQGKTVLVDFTANWCLTCITNLQLSINTAPVKKIVEAHDVVALKADKTEESPEIDALMRQLGFKTIPILAVFPADRPSEVLVLTDLVTQGQVVDLLNRAGPSRSLDEGVARITHNGEGL